MRAEDHQIVAPLYLASFVKAGQPGVKFDVEDTGYGWRLEGKAEAKDAVPAIKCTMRRP
jgi:branched-chain amino acid transport system substrate-binding protein